MSEQSTRPQPSARDAILSRIRTELAGANGSAADTSNATALSAPGALPAPGYQRLGSLSREACLELFIDRLVDYDATVLQVEGDGDLPAAITSALAGRNEQLVIVATEFPSQWLPPGIQVVVDGPAAMGPRTIQEIDSAQAVVTPCEVAVASSGTIVLKHVGAQGRRVLTLLPDHHICLVRREQVLELLPEALAMLDSASPAPVTTIAGPSATSDIEMTRIRGVHGPRRLTVILYGPE